MEIKYSEKSIKQITKIHKGDKKIAEKTLKTIEAYAKNPSGNFDIKVLKGKYGNFKRLRVGDFRVIFQEDKTDMLIYEIKHRKEAYND
ncbi:conserved hypothetical protein [Candidatus Jettenia caeni]|uniref:Plasmid stabilization system protein n=1 Tax=Candidatus Jettenia caeni TaxID=247490 RepID=I3IKE0_9BACT|nr:type II toxin-antitoxin system RelE/ParE family toxin [Candidatus Jettenia caeni]GAB62185.1 conserved hypothetical protein [Candidatus Jettenia caeni]